MSPSSGVDSPDPAVVVTFVSPPSVFVEFVPSVPVEQAPSTIRLARTKLISFLFMLTSQDCVLFILVNCKQQISSCQFAFMRFYPVILLFMLIK